MTSRQRIAAAIRHQEPDRLPIDFGATSATGIQAVAYNRLKAHLGLENHTTRVFDMMLQLAEPEEIVLDRFTTDAINAGHGFAPDEWKDWTLSDGSPCQVPDWVRLDRHEGQWVVLNEEGDVVARMPAGSTYFTQTCWPLARDGWAACIDDLPAHTRRVCWRVLPEPMLKGGVTDANLRRIAEHTASLRRSSDRALVMPIGSALLAGACGLRRIDNFLMDLAADPANAEAMLDKVLALHLERLSRLLPAVADTVDIVWIGDDFGTENGPFISPQMFRRFLKPRFATLIGHIRKLAPKVTVFLHSCGSIYALLPDLIEAGFEVINPVQISARDMEPARLKREFGRDVTFWGGGCDTQHFLPRATPQQIRDHVRKNIDILAPGGGFVFCSVHNLLAEVPPEKIVAIYEAAIQ